MAAPAPTARPHDELAEGQFVALPLFAFNYRGVADVDLYGRRADEQEVQLVCDRRRGLAPNELASLGQHGHECLLVLRRDLPTVATALYANLQQIAADVRYPALQRIRLVQAACYQPIEDAFQLVACAPLVDLAATVGGVLSVIARQCSQVPHELPTVLAHDHSYAAHATNVAIYASVLALRFGETDDEQLRQIAIGALIHDLGLRRRRNRRGKPLLWCEATDQATRHPQDAYEAICERPDFSQNQRLMVYQHHEHMDGTGEPVGLGADEIHPWARILAVVNRFDALSCDRPHRARQPVANALAALNAQAGPRLDAGVVACWTDLLQQS